MSGEQEGLPEGWAWTTLPELAHGGGVFTDGDWVESKDQDPNGDVRLIQLADVGDGYYRNRSSRFLTSSKAEELNCTFLVEGDILISRLADPLGRACLFPGDEKTSVTVVDVAVFRCGAHAVADHSWMKNWINASQFRLNIDQKSSGTTRKRISRKNLGSIEFPLPPLNEQRRIVAKIESLQARSEAAKEALDAIPPLLEKFRQSVLAAAFRGDLTASWRAKNPDVEPASVLLERIRAERRTRWIADAAEKGRARAEARARKAGKPWTAADDAKVLDKERVKAAKKYQAPEPVDAEQEGLPELPEGWCWARLGEVTSRLTYGITVRPKYIEKGTPIISAKEIRTGEINLAIAKRMNTADFQNLREKCKIYPGDVLFSKTGTIGRVARAVGQEPMASSQNIAVLTPLIRGDFLETALRSPGIQRRAYLQVQGNAVRDLPLGVLSKFPIPLPPVVEQVVLNKLVKTALLEQESLVDVLHRSAAFLVRLNQSILAQAFRGELVPQDPTDEPASVLLERIRAEREAAEAAKKAAKRRRRVYA